MIVLARGGNTGSSALGYCRTVERPRYRRLAAKASALEDLSFAELLRETVARLVREGVPSLDQASKRLDVPRRTLQRRLARRSMTFRGLVDGARLEEAHRLLASSDLRMSEIAKTMGYTDPGSFTRAFERWTGVAPVRYRAQLLGSRSSAAKDLPR